MSRTEPSPRTLRSPSLVRRHTSRRSRAQQLRVLLAEDDHEFRHLVASSVREDGHVVWEVTDGATLLERLADDLLRGRERGSFDLVISDVRMPLCSGLQVLEGLRDAGWATPIILMTAFGDPQSRATAERLSSILLDKPFDLDDLRRLVRDFEKWPLARGPREQREGSVESASGPDADEQEPPITPMPLHLQARSILLAEDDAELRHLLSSELRADGYAVFAACDGNEMLEVLSDVSELRLAGPDVIVMDVRMPGRSGLQILTALRAAHWPTPVILITAFGDLRLHEEAARLGAVVLDKPLDVDDLRTALLHLARAEGSELH